MERQITKLVITKTVGTMQRKLLVCVLASPVPGSHSLSVSEWPRGVPPRERTCCCNSCAHPFPKQVSQDGLQERAAVTCLACKQVTATQRVLDDDFQGGTLTPVGFQEVIFPDKFAVLCFELPLIFQERQQFFWCFPNGLDLCRSPRRLSVSERARRRPSPRSARPSMRLRCA